MNRSVAAGALFVALVSALAAAPILAQHSTGQKPPFAGGDTKATDPEVDKLVAHANKLEKQAKAKPKDAKLQKQVGEAYYQAGHAMMTSPKLTSRVKYPGSLRLLRVALKYDPKHAKAAQEKKMLEDIYRSMSRPIPK